MGSLKTVHETWKLIVCLLVAAGLAGPLRGQVALDANPAFAGDLPDPSVVRDGKWYWATATGAVWARAVPPQRPLERLLHGA